ncbi:hypothetical protein DFA_02376 [Cavenderia fasciculata]|uniref:Ankyrin repeat protein n=1 Tax=Cavenderia fasciculata TaxID=261658 RepID=F4PZA0_CACFS|nr:uncharacterized protein DFA_02376 [Cavenderia fasciculata]EGG19129.1 hypothetical protein DFA_02376 [Cavenderia fasciculata]|eukprot:XP_004366762.1 hypothetical protein DFA_02376 [Cavenderia fasciculata]
MAASKGNIEMFKILADHTIPIKPIYDTYECITAAIQGMHPDMAVYLLEMNNYKFNVNRYHRYKSIIPFSINGSLSKHSQSDLIKLARLFVDIVNNNKNDGITMDKLFKNYFINLLMSSQDIESIKYANGHFTRLKMYYQYYDEEANHFGRLAQLSTKQSR